MKTFYLALFCFIYALNATAQPQSSELYKDSSRPISERVQNLISQLTLAEKIGQMTQLNITLINNSGEQRDVTLNEEKARKYLLEYHIGSFLNGEAASAEDWYNFIYNLQKIAVEETRMGIPILYGIDHMHGASYLKDATIFPHNINIAATFDADHAAQAARITVLESAALGHNWVFAPVLDLGRNPRWARFYETYGESYHVASVMGKAYVRALQNNEDIAPYKVAATGKHFLGYSDPKSGWDRTPVDLSEQTIFEFHAPAFQAAIDAGMQSIMVNSSEINGVPVHASKKILTDLLRNKMGFKGVILTDWDDIGKLVHYHYTARNYTEATKMAVHAGIDMSMTPTSLDFNTSLLELVKNGEISEERINESVERILTLKFELGLFENPYPTKDYFEKIGAPEHQRKAKIAAQESIVLLKNEDGVLPLSKETKSILLIGPSANSKRNLAGGWTIAWQGATNDRYPEDMHTIFSALQEEFPNAVITLIPENSSKTDLLAKAKNHDVIIAAIGEEPYTEFIGNITSMELPENQQVLIETASESGTPVVGIFIGGRPLIVSDIIDYMDAYFFAGLPGFEGGEALADILSGDVNPSAKLPFSYPVYSAHFVPYNHKPSDVYFFDPNEENSITQDEKNVWQWPFGYGLSYTDFSYSAISLSDSTLTGHGSITASVTVSNTGNVPGKEAIIWYLKDHVGKITRPVKEVKHFDKIDLAVGESKEVSFKIKPQFHLAYPDEYGNEILEHGYFTVSVGNQSKSFYLKENQITSKK